MLGEWHWFDRWVGTVDEREPWAVTFEPAANEEARLRSQMFDACAPMHPDEWAMWHGAGDVKARIRARIARLAWVA